MKQDSRCRHTYVYNAQVSPWTLLCDDVFERYTNRMRRAFFGRFTADQLLLNIFVANVKLDFETYGSSLKLKKAEIFMQEFRDKRMMGHEFRRCGFKIKVKWKGIGKKGSFLTTFYRFLKRFICIDSDRSTRFTMSTYLCIMCIKFTLEHYFVDDVSKDTPIMEQGRFLGLPAGSTTIEHFCGERQTWFWDLLKHLV